MNEEEEKNRMLIEQNLRERMASLEATNNFHRETLNDISSSLKEVVKTQHVLANQREEIHKLINIVNENQKDILSLKQDNMITKYQIKENKEDLDEIKVKIKEMNTTVNDNANFVKTAAKVVTTIGIPLILAVVMQYFKK